MDKLPTTSFTWSPDTEIDRILFTAKSISNGFYTGNNFIVLPYLNRPGDTSRVVLPQLEYSKIDNFWDKIAKLERGIPMSVNKDFQQELKKILTEQDFKGINPDRIIEVEDNWSKVEHKYWKLVAEIFPEKIKRIKNIEVRITRFGTISSMSHLHEHEDEAYIYLREDATISHMASIIIKILLFESLTVRYSWRERMGIADFLMTNSKLKSLFPQHEHIVNALNNAQEDNFNKSRKFLEKIGVRYKKKPLSLSEDHILSNGKTIDNYLTNREREILRWMLEQKRLITFDEIADLMWDDPDDYSLWAMNKAMQRLRNKLVDLGLPKDSLMTKRKEGYYLNI